MFARMKALEPGLFEDAVRCGCDSVVGWRCVDSKGHSLANWNWKKMSLPEHQDTTLSKNKLIQAVPLGICGTSGGIAFNVAAGQILSWHLPRFAQGSNLQHGQGKASLTLETIHQQFSLGFWYMHIRIYSICASATILKVAKCLANIAPHATWNRCFGASCIRYLSGLAPPFEAHSLGWKKRHLQWGVSGLLCWTGRIDGTRPFPAPGKLNMFFNHYVIM